MASFSVYIVYLFLIRQVLRYIAFVTGALYEFNVVKVPHWWLLGVSDGARTCT